MYIEFQTFAASGTPRKTPNLWSAHINLAPSGYLAVLFEPTCSRSLAAQVRVPSKRAFNVLTEHLLQDTGLDPEVSLEQVFSAIHERLVRSFPVTVATARSPDLVGVAALVWNDTLHVAHIGTARCYLARGGELHPLTEDHSEAVAARMRTEIVPGTERDHEGYATPTRALGRPEQGTPEIRRPGIPLLPGDEVLLLSTELHVSLAADDLRDVVFGERKTTLSQDLITAARASWTPETEGGALIATCTDQVDDRPRDDQITQKFVRDQLAAQLGPEATAIDPDDDGTDRIEIDLPDVAPPPPRRRPKAQPEPVGLQGLLSRIPPRVRKRLGPALLSVALAALTFVLWIAWPTGDGEAPSPPVRRSKEAVRSSAPTREGEIAPEHGPVESIPSPAPLAADPEPPGAVPPSAAPDLTATLAADAARAACQKTCGEALKALDGVRDDCERKNRLMQGPWESCMENPDCAMEESMRGRWSRLWEQAEAGCNAALKATSSVEPLGLECETRRNILEKTRVRSHGGCKQARILSGDYQRLCTGVSGHNPTRIDRAIGAKCFTMYQTECTKETEKVLSTIKDGKPKTSRAAHKKLLKLGGKDQVCLEKEHLFGKGATQSHTNAYMAYKKALKHTK